MPDLSPDLATAVADWLVVRITAQAGLLRLSYPARRSPLRPFTFQRAESTGELK